VTHIWLESVLTGGQELVYAAPAASPALGLFPLLLLGPLLRTRCTCIAAGVT